MKIRSKIQILCFHFQHIPCGCVDIYLPHVQGCKVCLCLVQCTVYSENTIVVVSGIDILATLDSHKVQCVTVGNAEDPMAVGLLRGSR